MAEVSDYTVATGQRFLSGSAPLSASFASGLRNPGGRAVLQFSGLGGYKEGRAALTVKVSLNATRIGTVFVRRWTDHAYIVPDSLMLDFPADLLRSSGANTLKLEPEYADGSDYCWMGPAVVHFKQNS